MESVESLLYRIMPSAYKDAWTSFSVFRTLSTTLNMIEESVTSYLDLDLIGTMSNFSAFTSLKRKSSSLNCW